MSLDVRLIHTTAHSPLVGLRVVRGPLSVRHFNTSKGRRRNSEIRINNSTARKCYRFVMYLSQMLFNFLRFPTTGIGSDIGGYLPCLLFFLIYSCNAFQVPSVYLPGSMAYMVSVLRMVAFHTLVALILLKAKIPYSLFLDRCRTAWLELNAS